MKVKDMKKTHQNLRKINTNLIDNYTSRFILNYKYFNVSFKQTSKQSY